MLGASCGSSDSGSFGGLVVVDAGISSDAGSKDAGFVQPPADAGAAIDAAPGTSCDEYCSLTAANCSGASAQYTNPQECLAFCGSLEQGLPGARTGNTVACRAFYADDPARTAPPRYCPAAGLLGGEVCGSRCESFCGAAMVACGADAPFPSFAACTQACAGEPGFPLDKSAPEGAVYGKQNDTLNCRTDLLRIALRDPSKACADLGTISAICTK